MGASHTALVQHCKDAASPYVDTSAYSHINYVTDNGYDYSEYGFYLNSVAGGVVQSSGFTFMSLDSVTDHSVWAHELGHTIELPHSPGANGATYGNDWTVMSSNGRWQFGPFELGFLDVAQHPNVFEKNKKGWIDADELLTVNAESVEVVIDPSHLNHATAGNYRAVIIPIEGSIDYYTVEVRKSGSEGGIYDGNLPGSGVIIHAVLESRDEPAHLIGREGLARGEEAWQAGETF